MNFIEKILNHWTFLFINVVIIFAAELSGEYFAKSGIIHLIAIFFILLGFSRIMVHYDAYDQYLKMIIHGGIAALVIFSASHAVEFLSYEVLKISEDAIFASVVNFYLISLLAILIGAEYFLKAAKRRSWFAIGFFALAIAAFLALTAAYFLNDKIISLEPDETAIYIYAPVVLLVAAFGISRFLQVRRTVSIMSDFMSYFIAAFALITISALQYIFYEILEEAGIPYSQTMYMSHFLFYGALSLMFLAFTRLAHLGGVYAAIEEKNKKYE